MVEIRISNHTQSQLNTSNLSDTVIDANFTITDCDKMGYMLATELFIPSMLSLLVSASLLPFVKLTVAFIVAGLVGEDGELEFGLSVWPFSGCPLVRFSSLLK